MNFSNHFLFRIIVNKIFQLISLYYYSYIDDLIKNSNIL